MAQIAFRCRNDMRRPLAFRENGVVAGRAACCGFGVIKSSRGLPQGRRDIVAFFAIVAGG